MKKPACIYCGTEIELSESDIIPDALTNARITNKNVCKTEHNNKFSDMFESKVISALALITNELDVKSKKGKNYAAYPAIVKIDEIDYSIMMTSEKSVFDGRVLTSVDKKHRMSSMEKIESMAKDNNQVEAVDVNNMMLEKNVKIDLEVYFSIEMFRMVAKIAFEWYCSKNSVTGYHEEFKNIINFITKGEGDNPVAIIRFAEIYDYYENEVNGGQINLGSHCLWGFQDADGQINVVLSLFGIVMYRIIVAEKTPDFCSNNFLYLELRTDASRKEITNLSYEHAQEYFDEKLLNMDNFCEAASFNGLKIMVQKSVSNDNIVLYPTVLNMTKCFKHIGEELINPNQEITNILMHNISNVLQASLLHKKSVKRFVKDYFFVGHEPIKLNPNSTNKKMTFLFYILFNIGKRDVTKMDDRLLQEIAKSALNMGQSTDITIDNELEKRMITEMINTEEYPEILEHGAKAIKDWN